MPWWIPSISYPPAQDGYWSPVTSTLNWCEEDYYATIYSAEIVNTVTNLLFMYLAVKGISNCVKHGHDAIFVITFIGYLLVGTGSFLFHATLKYPMQLVDELSMIYTTCLMVYATFSYGKSGQYGLILGLSLVTLALSITGYYHYLQDPAFHQNMYALLTAIVLFRSMYVMEVNIRPSLRAKTAMHSTLKRQEPVGDKEKIQQEQDDQRDREILKDMWTMIAYGLTIFLGGFAVWTVDNVYCSSLRRWRREVGLPWGVLLEGHGWWHLMTGVGAYFYITWGIWLRHCLNGQQDQYQLRWPRLLTSLPEIVRVQPVMAKAVANGEAKKTL